MDTRGDRQSNMKHSTVKGHPKKDGAGGQYTWGANTDMPEDWQPSQTSAPKVSAEPTRAPKQAPPSASLAQLGVKLESRDQFPNLAANAQQRPQSPGAKALGAAVTKMNTLWERATGVAFDARQRVASAYDYAQEQVTTRIRKPITDRVNATIAQAVAAKTALVDTTTSTYTNIKDNGLKTWTIDSAKSVVALAQDLVVKTKSKTFEAVIATRQLVSQKAGEKRQLVVDGVSATRAKVVEATEITRSKTAEGAALAHAKSKEYLATAKEVAMDKSVQSAAASAAGGAIALGSAGGATGLAAGTVAGAAVGLVPALFTFGLSIPIGAAIGGGAGLVVGATAGTTVGALGGGSAGYAVYKRKDDIAECASRAVDKVNDSKEYVKGRASASASYAREQMAVVRARLVGGGTGSTEDH